MNKVFVAGGATVDKIIYVENLPEPKPGTIFSKEAYDTIGSTGCGKVMSLQKLGMKTIFHAMIGDDKAGRFIKDSIEENGSDFIFDIDLKGTEEHVNILDDNGRRISIFTQYATFDPQLEWNKFEKVIEESDYVVLNIINYVRNLIPIAKKYKKEVWCDIHDYDGENEYHKEFINAADYIFMSSENIKDYKKFMEKMIAEHKKLVVCTHGKKGASVLSLDGQFLEMPIIDEYERIDTNGAGDNFFSGFLYAYSKGYQLKKCMQYGTITAGLCINSKEIVNPVLSETLLEQEYQKYYNRKGEE